MPLLWDFFAREKVGKCPLREKMEPNKEVSLTSPLHPQHHGPQRSGVRQLPSTTMSQVAKLCSLCSAVPASACWPGLAVQLLWCSRNPNLTPMDSGGSGKNHYRRTDSFCKASGVTARCIDLHFADYYASATQPYAPPFQLLLLLHGNNPFHSLFGSFFSKKVINFTATGR